VKRYPHYWWTLKGKFCPSRIAVADSDATAAAESQPAGRGQEAEPQWSIVWSDYRRGEPIASGRLAGVGIAPFWGGARRLLSLKQTTWLFVPGACDTLGELGLWEYLEDGKLVLAGADWRVDRNRCRTGDTKTSGLCVIQDPPTLILCGAPDLPGKLLILDTRNLGIEPEDLHGDHRERAAGALSGIRDIVQTLRESGPYSLRGTAGSQAVQILRSSPDCVRLHCHTNERALAVERAALHGGRCEAYRLGEIAGPVYHVDVRSMYPSICLNLPIPVSIRRYYGERRSGEAAEAALRGHCVARVRVATGVPVYPCSRGGQTVYPVGVFDTTLCGEELRRAAAAGSVVRWYDAAEYTCAPILSELYRTWLALLRRARDRGRLLEASFIKRLMNALIGKFAEPGRRWVPCPFMPGAGPYGKFTCVGPDGSEQLYRNVAGWTQRQEEHQESYWSIPAITAWVTAAGRCRLWDYLETAGRETVWYVDTDSLVCNTHGYDRLLRSGFIREGEVGHLRTVGRYSRATIYGIRHYVLDDTVKCAGPRRGTIRPDESRPEYWDRIQADAEVSMGLRPGTLSRRKRAAGREPYRHGVVGDDGCITPFEINDG
jgi:DNA polymerase type B, organellar and viral